MSVVRQLLQIAAVEALRGATIAGNDVYDSRIDTLPDLLKDARRPVLIVSVETSTQQPGTQEERGLLGRDTRLKMLVQASVASGVELQDEEGTVIVAEVGETDAAFEARLNILDRQWRSILHYGEGKWAVIWRDLVNAIGKISDQRAVDPETGRKHAARFTEVELDVVWEPVAGMTLAENIDAGLTAMEEDGDPSYREVARVFRETLTLPEGWPDWRSTQSSLWLSDKGLLALGLGPLAADEERNTPAMMQGGISFEGKPDVIVEGE